ncbi:hypothetical protein AB6802_08265 [Mesorhizobium sp. RCC_202]|uniref:hypothetical protein n=1 Tax=Mesorhizobium sp. RCC_202 TaxID=3239222 RepID=UPI0035257BBE
MAVFGVWFVPPTPEREEGSESQGAWITIMPGTGWPLSRLSVSRTELRRRRIELDLYVVGGRGLPAVRPPAQWRPSHALSGRGEDRVAERLRQGRKGRGRLGGNLRKNLITLRAGG